VGEAIDVETTIWGNWSIPIGCRTRSRWTAKPDLVCTRPA